MVNKMASLANENKKGKRTFSSHVNLIRFSVMILLGICSYLTMLLGKIPNFQYHGILEYEFSDLFVIIAYSLYGYLASIFVGLMKTSLVMATFLSSVSSPLPTGYLVSILSTLCVSTFFLIVDRCLHFFKRILPVRLITYLFLSICTSIFMIAIDYVFAVPTLANGNVFITIYESDPEQILMNLENLFQGYTSYDKAVLSIFVPFNLIKCASICFLYEVFFYRFIYKFLKSGYFEKGYFMNRYDYLHEDVVFSLRKRSKRRDRVVMMQKRRIEKLKRRNANREEEEEAPTEVVLNRYRYDFTIDDFGAIKEISIDSFQETSGVIVHYLNSLYPNSKYRILSYKETETIVRDGAHDWLPDDLFKAVNGFDKEITHVIKLTVKIR